MASHLRSLTTWSSSRVVGVESAVVRQTSDLTIVTSQECFGACSVTGAISAWGCSRTTPSYLVEPSNTSWRKANGTDNNAGRRYPTELLPPCGAGDGQPEGHPPLRVQSCRTLSRSRHHERCER